MLGIGYSSSSHADNQRNDFLILGEGDTFDISINFSKAKTKFCLSLHYNGDNNYLSVNGKKIYTFKASHKNVSFRTQFCLGIISNKFNYNEAEEVSLK